MLLKPLSVAALVAASATANAFLIPPQLSDLDIEVVEIIETVPLPETSEKVEVACPGCSMRDMDVAPANHLELSFAIDQRRLLVNGFELYPSADPFQRLYALQLPDDPKEMGELDAMPLSPERLGYTLQVQTVQPVAAKGDDNDDGDEKLELVQVDLQIIEVGDVFVKGISNVRVKLIKSGGKGGDDEKLMIGSIETTASQNPDTTDEDGNGEECTTLMCKWIAYAQEKMRKMKEHVKAKPCHGNGMGMPAKPWRMGHHGGPGHRGHGHGHGHGHDDNDHRRPPHFDEATNPHSIGKLLRNIASHILFPVLIGVIAGVSVSLIGMIIGTLVVSTWRAFSARRNGPEYTPVAGKEDDEDVSGDEKSGLIEHQDPPPAYDEEQDVKKMDV